MTRTRRNARRGHAIACALAVALLALTAGDAGARAVANGGASSATNGGAGAATNGAPSRTGPCAHAAALYEAKYYADAELAYKRLLGIARCARPQDVAIAQKARAAAAPSADDLIAAAKHARDAGFEARSRALVQQLVETYPDTPVPADLQAPDQRVGFWQSGLDTVGPWLHLAVEVLIALLAALVALTVLALAPFAIWRSIQSRRRRSLAIVPFVGAHADQAGAAIVSGLHEHIGHLRSRQASRTLYFADSGESHFEDLPEAITSAFPQAGIVAALVTLASRLGPRRLWRVTGTLLPADSDRGVGITLVLGRQREQTIDQRTFWEDDFHLVPDSAAGSAGDDDLASRYQRLALPAAVWLAYQPALGFTPDTPSMGTDDWMSYAKFAVGEERHTYGEEPHACRLYCEALDLDPGNLGARTNLASLLLQPLPDEPRDQRIEREQLLEVQIAHVTHAPSMSMATDDPLWYRIHWLEAIAHLYAGRLDPAARSGKLLVATIKRQLESGPKSLRPLLERFLFPARVLCANVEVERADAGQQALAVPVPEPYGDWIGEAGHYNLACHHARKLQKLIEGDALASCVTRARRRLIEGDLPPQEQTACRKRALYHLRISFLYGDAGGKPPARTDPALVVLHGDPEFERLVADAEPTT